MNLQEELDVLKVKMAQDAATVYELRSCLEQEREGARFLPIHKLYTWLLIDISVASKFQRIIYKYVTRFIRFCINDCTLLVTSLGSCFD